ncbi:hypothetical protein [Crocinitomix catalasitica]|uniref:hypothetical protein n=1 Tax=Crocinitomix catalasitica TaxID=184607 RepID=UPI0004812E58|nr:hypothetical protein [Crocinitomix catalasitica]
MLPTNSEYQLVDLFDKEKFVAETIAQINKDFAYELPPFTTVLDVNGGVVLKDLVSQLEIILREFNYSALLQSIYRIDLNERKFNNALQADDFSKIAYLIIERSAQKVYLRWSYK